MEMADGTTGSPIRGCEAYRRQIDEMWDSIHKLESRLEESRSELERLATILRRFSDQARIVMESWNTSYDARTNSRATNSHRPSIGWPPIRSCWVWA